GMLLSVVAVMLEEMSFHIYANPMYVVTLFFASLIENFGYRQLNSWWRMTAMYHIARNNKPQWGNMKRNANWKK
ncbi:MAG: glycosyltransferase family 2 protein, partial [Gammaproteobacteria bacterium]|nr:glycosyltransferase family 2 protein [Gammaproteobacteria bacterium]